VENKYVSYFKVLLFVLCISVGNNSAWAQGEASIWYFHNAGLDFSGGAPVPISGGTGLEGCAVISDAAGNLLFYTDGSVVRNRNHSVMPNGAGLLAGTSSTQAAIIVQQPGSTTRYYIFTCADLSPGIPSTRFFEYSVVDMTLNGGLGDIIPGSKNIVPVPGLEVSERVAAAPHANGTDIWIATAGAHTSTAFYAFRLTPTGLNHTPVISDPMVFPLGRVGQLKFSPDGSLAAIGNYLTSPDNLLDFDTNTGVFSNLRVIPNHSSYGLEFSPDGSKLYSFIDSTLYQFSNLTGSWATIWASRYEVGKVTSPTTTEPIRDGRALQLGPDGKIYCTVLTQFFTGYQKLSVINNPNAVGAACNFTPHAQDLAGRTAHAGLPTIYKAYLNFPPFFPEITVKGNDTEILSGDTSPAIADFTDFGSVTTCAPGLHTFTIHNLGSTALNLTGTPLVSISGDAEFAITAQPSVNTIYAGDSLSFTVAYTPTAAGSHTAVISILSDDSDEGTYTFTVQGTGTAGCSEIEVLGNGISITNGDTSPSALDHTDFGLHDACAATITPITRTFTIQNNSLTHALNLTSAPLVGILGSTDFIVSAQPSASSVGINNSVTFDVTYMPVTPGLQSATLIIINDDPNDDPFLFEVQGNGGGVPGREIDILGNTISIASGDNTPDIADHTDFDSTIACGASLSRTFTIQNLGTTDLSLFRHPSFLVELLGADAEQFNVTVQPTSDIVVPCTSNAETFTIVYQPTALGTHTATVRILNNDSDEGTYTFTIQGNAATSNCSEIAVLGNGIGIANGDNSPSAADNTDFGTHDFCAPAPVTRTFTIENNSASSPLNLTGTSLVSISGSSDFTISAQPTTSTVGTNSSVTFAVTYNPTTPGLQGATVSIASDDLTKNPYTFDLQADGGGSAGAAWVNVGGAGFSPGNADFQHLVFHPTTHEPYVAFKDGTNGGATVMRYDGASWINVGLAGFSAGSIEHMSLAFHPLTHEPHVAYRDFANGGRTTVKRYDGTSWSNVGTAGFTALSATTQNQYLAFHPGTYEPYVAFQEDIVSNRRTTVMRFDGINWVTVGVAGFTAGASEYQQLVFHPSTHEPYVAFRDWSSTGRATVMRFDGTSWVSVGATGFSAGSATFQSLAFHPVTNEPYLAYSDDSQGDRTTVMRFDGTNWVTVGTVGFSAGRAEYQSLAFHPFTHEPYVAYRDWANSIRTTVMRFNGTTWLNAGAVGFSAGSSSYQSLAFHPSTYEAYVAYCDFANARHTTVMRLTPTPRPEILVAGNGVEITNNAVVPTVADGTVFGSATFCGSVSQTFTIKNVGRADLTLSGSPRVTLSGAGAAQFSLVAQPSSGTIASCGLETFEISYNPTVVGTHSATVTITSNDDDEATYSFPIQGITPTSGCPEMDVLGNGVSIANGDFNPSLTDGTDFGTHNFCAPVPLTHTFTIQNTGGLYPLNLTGTPQVTLSGSADFVISAQPTASVAAGSNVSFDVTYTPTNPGIQTAILSITSNDLNDSPYSFLLQADGGGTFGDAWVNKGNADFSMGTAHYQSLAFHPGSNEPYVAFRDFSNSGGATVMRFDGLNWVNVGSPNFSAGNAVYQSLAFHPVTQEPYVAYQGAWARTVVMRYDGTSWVSVGAATGFSVGGAYFQSLAFHPTTHEPYVAYQDGANGNRATVMRFDGTSWITVGAVGFSATSASYQSLAFHPTTHEPYVAYRSWSIGNRTTVMRYDGTSWVNVGAADFSAGSASYQSLAFHPSTHEPYLAYRDGANGSATTVMRFDGTSWVSVGAAGFSAGSAEYQSLAFHPSTHEPYVAYSDILYGGRTTVMRFDGRWKDVSAAGFSVGGTRFQSLAFNPSTHKPYVAYSGNWSSGERTTVMYLGVVPEADIAIFGNGAEIVNGTNTASVADDTDFGATASCGAGTAHTFMIQNTGTANLTLTGTPFVTLSGADVGQFSLTTQPTGGSFTACHTETFVITYQPNTVGVHSARVNVLSDDNDEGNYSFTIQGTSVPGSCAEIDVLGNGVSITNGDNSPSLADHTDFGTHDFCASTSFTRSFTIQNMGLVNALSLTGAPAVMLSGSSDFTVSVQPTTATITANNSVTFEITYTASQPGVQQAVVSIANDDTDEGLYTFAIEANGGGAFGAAWAEVGTPGFSADDNQQQSLAFHPSTHEPYVAYRSGWSVGNRTTVMRFDGTNWVNVGTAGFSAGSANFQSLAFHPSTHEPYVAFRDGGNGNRTTVMRFDGTNWVNVGTAGFSAGSANFQSLAFHPSTHEPYVAFRDGGNGNRTTVMRFDGFSWVNVGTAGFSAAASSYQSLAFHPISHAPYVAFQDWANGNATTVMYFDGTNWVNVGTAGFSAGSADYQSLAFNLSTHEPYVAFRDASYSTTVMRFDGTNWVNVGATSFSGVGADFQSLAFHPSTHEPYVAYKRTGWAYGNRTTVMRFDGTNWLDVGAPLFSAGRAEHQSLAFHPHTHEPYVAYQDFVYGQRTTVMRLGPSPEAEIAIFGNGIEIISGAGAASATNDTDFGAVVSCSGSVSHTFTIENQGTVDLTLSGSPFVVLSGADAGQFSITTQPTGSNVAVCNAETFVVTYTPTALGTHTATITVANSDSDEGTYTFVIQGTAATSDCPEIDVLGNGVSIPSGDVSPSFSDNTDFGTHNFCTPTTITRSFTIQNTGATGILNLTGSPSVAISGSADFTVSVQPTSATVAPSGSVTFEISYTSTLPGIQHATVSITNNDPDEAPYTFSLQADGGGVLASAWANVGTVGFSAGRAEYQSLAFHPATHEPYVAYSDDSQGDRTTVMRFDGANWVNVGTVGFSVGRAEFQSLAFHPVTHEPYVAYQDNWVNGYGSTVMRFDGTNWVTVGTEGFSAGEARFQSLAFHPSTNEPYVAYRDLSNSSRTTVMHFNGTNWVNVGAAGFSAGTSNYQSLAFHPSTHEPYVAYQDYWGYGSRATVMRFDGTSWVNVGAVGFSAGSAGYSSLAFHPATHEPYVAYRDAGHGSRATVMRFDGASWINVGTAGFSANWVEYSSLAFHPATHEPYVAYRDAGRGNSTTVMRFDGTSWVNVGAAGFSANWVEYQSLAFHPATHEPYVAYREGWANGFGTTVMRLAPNPETEIRILGNGTEIISGATTASGIDNTEFGNVTACDLGVAHTFTIENAGTAALNLSGTPLVTLSGAGAAYFSVSTQPASNTVATCATDTFVITYQPTALGTHSATVTIQSNDSDEGTYTFTIQGTANSAACPEIDVLGNGISIASGDTSPEVADNTDFGVHSLCMLTPVTHTFTIQNTNPAAPILLTGSPLVTISGSTDFVISAQPPATVAPNTSVTFEVTYTPATPGVQTATISIANNDVDESLYTFTVQADAGGVVSSSWVDVGAAGFSAGYAFDQSMAFHPATHEPYVAYSDFANGGTTVMRFDGTSWVSVGALSFSAGMTSDQSLAFHPTTHEPYVAFQDWANGSHTTVMRFDGTSWVNVGTAGFSAGVASDQSLAFHPITHDPYVAYNDVANGSRTTVMRFDGTSWVNVGTAGFSAGIALNQSLAFHPTTHEPYVAYNDWTLGNRIAVMHFDGTNWVNVGASGFSAGSTAGERLAFHPTTHEPYVAYIDNGNAGRATVMRFNGTSWVNVGAAGFSAGVVSDRPSLAFHPNTHEPYLAYSDDGNAGRATVMRFNGTSWVNVGVAGFSGGIVYSTSLAFHPITQLPYVAFRDWASFHKTTVMRLDLVLPEPEILISGNGVEIVSGASTASATDHTDFGSATTCTTVSQTFTVANVSTLANLTLSGPPFVVLSGADSAEFSITAQPVSGVIGTCGSLTFELTYQPTTVGVHTTTVRVVSDDSDEGTYTFAIQGEATACATSPTGGGNTPIRPANFIVAIAQDTSRIEVKWLHSWPDEDGFYLYRATEDGDYFQIAVVPPSIGSDTVRYMDTGLDADTQYHYFVRAYRGADMSTHSDQAEDITYPHTPTVSNLEACYGTAATFLASGTHRSGAYRWYTDSLRSTEAIKDGSGAEVNTATYQTGYLENDKEVWVRAVGRRYQSWPAKAVATLKPLPAITLLSAANISSCNASEILAIQEVAGATYQWYRGNEAVAGATNATYEATANNRYRVEVSLNGCTAWSNFIMLRLNRKVNLFIEQGEVARFCDAGTLSATDLVGASYEWRKDGSTLGNARTQDVNESGVYQLIANDGSCEVIREITVEIPTFPTDLSLTSSDNDLCPGEEATLNVSNFAGTYNWLRNGRFFTSTDVPTLTTSTPGEYTVEFVAGTCTEQSESFMLNVNDVPQVRIRRDGDELFLSIEGQVTSTSITWFLDDVAQPGLTDERIAPTQVGVYRAELTFGSCPTGSGGKYFSPSAVTGMEDQPELENKALVIYPNPTPDALFVQLPQLAGKVSLELVDNLGRTLQHKSQEVSGAETLQLNLKGLPAGTYLLKVYHEELGESLHKIVKE